MPKSVAKRSSCGVMRRKYGATGAASTTGGAGGKTMGATAAADDAEDEPEGVRECSDASPMLAEAAFVSN